MLKVLFLGNHDVGVTSLNALLTTTKVVGVVAHPPDPEDGRVYKSLYAFAQSKNLKIIRGKAKDSNVFNFIKSCKPDLIWVTDYRYLIPKEVIALSRLGAVNLHPSLLPKYRGRAPINWAIINGEKLTGLTAHFIDEGVDSGDIILQKQIQIGSSDYVADILNKFYPLYDSLTRKTIELIESKTLKLQSQQLSGTIIYPRRKPDDGLIDWNQSAENVINLIRAVSKPYPGAFTYFEDRKITIWRAELEEQKASLKDKKAGEVLEVLPDCFRVLTGYDGIIKVTSHDTENFVLLSSGDNLNSK